MQSDLDRLTASFNNITLANPEPYYVFADLYQVQHGKYILTHEDVHVVVKDVSICVTDYSDEHVLFELPINWPIYMFHDTLFAEYDNQRFALSLEDYTAATQIFTRIHQSSQ